MRRRIVGAARCVIAIVLGMVVFTLAILVLKHGKKASVEMLLKNLPHNGWIAALLLWCLFALKSVSMVFPLALLFAASGVFYPLPQALLVNEIGLCITVTVPYLMGRHYGVALIATLKKKHPKIAELQKMEQHHDFFRSFIIRAVGILPYDIVSLYMGASRGAYAPYLGGCIAGCFFHLLTATILGMNVENPLSPEFLIVLAIHVLFLVFSSYIYYFRIRKQ
ncbi:MAG: VTT domain-containing protein [Eubacteriales bacterium]|nr:VTT domain-containing protein [Eubacteriales bacterium]